QQESQDYGGHTVVPERLLYKELKSGADEEQQAGTSNNPSRPLELSVLPSLAVHKITICSRCGHCSCRPATAFFTVIVRGSPVTALAAICQLCSMIQSETLPQVAQRYTHPQPLTYACPSFSSKSYKRSFSMSPQQRAHVMRISSLWDSVLLALPLEVHP